MQISTLPALSSDPLTKRTVPFVQFWAAVGEKSVVVFFMKIFYVDIDIHIYIFILFYGNAKSI